MPRPFLDAILKRKKSLSKLLRASRRIHFHHSQSITARCSSSTFTRPSNNQHTNDLCLTLSVEYRSPWITKILDHVCELAELKPYLRAQRPSIKLHIRLIANLLVCWFFFKPRSHVCWVPFNMYNKIETKSTEFGLSMSTDSISKLCPLPNKLTHWTPTTSRQTRPPTHISMSPYFYHQIHWYRIFHKN